MVLLIVFPREMDLSKLPSDTYWPERKGCNQLMLFVKNSIPPLGSGQKYQIMADEILQNISLP